MKVKFIQNKEISSNANALLNLFKEKNFSYPEDTKTNIEAISSFIGLKIDFIDLKNYYNETTLGMIIPQEKSIFIDRSLEPFGNDKDLKEKIFRFTLAHEIGHYQLHKNYDPVFFHTLNKKERDRIEIQANKFASYILMPHNSFCAKYQKHNRLTDNIYDVVNALSQEFNVSKQAIKLRIKEVNM